MKVRELIALLSACDPEADVIVPMFDMGSGLDFADRVDSAAYRLFPPDERYPHVREDGEIPCVVIQ